MKILNLREQRRLVGWTQARAARAAGVHRSILSQLETGDIPASDPRGTKVRRALRRAITKKAVRIGEVLASAVGDGVEKEQSVRP
jgi:predicted transcriptional regulator